MSEVQRVRLLGSQVVHDLHPMAGGKPIPRCGAGKRRLGGYGRSVYGATWSPAALTSCRRCIWLKNGQKKGVKS